LGKFSQKYTVANNRGKRTLRPRVCAYVQPEGRRGSREHEVVHIPQRSSFVLPNMTVFKGAPSWKAASGVRGELMTGLSDHELAELRKIFDGCDLNGDGFINPEEFHALLIKLDGDVSREECQLDFDVADSEGDGYIGFKEFVVWWTG
jgi:hypothetical protein